MYTLILSAALAVGQLPMANIVRGPVTPVPPKTVTVVQKVVEVRYIGIDKFDVEHVCASRDELLRELRAANARPYVMTDCYGRKWQNTDKSALEAYINSVNAAARETQQTAVPSYYNYNRPTTFGRS